MPRYRITSEAREDLLSIREYLRAQSEDAWPTVWTEFKRVFRLVGDVPGSGHFRSDLTDRAYRFSGAYKYLVVYDPATSPVEIIAVFHSALDVRRDARLR